MPTQDTIWHNTVDHDQYRTEVNRTGPNCGVLKIFQISGGVLIHSEPVHLSFGAHTGVADKDIKVWAVRVLDVIDNPSKRRHLVG